MVTDCILNIVTFSTIDCLSVTMAIKSSPQHKHWPTGPAHFSDCRASTLYLSLALQDHRVKCRASRLKITVARSMTNFATFSCILCLKFRYVCIAWLLYIHFNVNCFLRLCLHYVWSVTNIDVGRGKMGASRFSWGPVTFQIYWPPGSRSLMLRAEKVISLGYN